jgi:3-phosphoshikimate 1-carboxyvinyltransferase
MAMSFAVLGALRPGVSIENPACVAKTYPTFWDDLGACYRAVGSPPPW